MRLRTIVPVIFLMGFLGCSRTSVYVLNQAELQRVKAGQVITAGTDGWLLSDRAVTRVMNAKIKQTNLQ